MLMPSGVDPLLEGYGVWILSATISEQPPSPPPLEQWCEMAWACLRHPSDAPFSLLCGFEPSFDCSDPTSCPAAIDDGARVVGYPCLWVGSCCFSFGSVGTLTRVLVGTSLLAGGHCGTRRAWVKWLWPFAAVETDSVLLLLGPLDKCHHPCTCTIYSPFPK